MIDLESTSADPAFNLAMEEYAFFHLDRSEEYFMLWQNREAVIIGKHQNAVEEVNLPFTEKHGIPVVRRLSGGGAVYHDLGNLNFTFLADRGKEGLSMERFASPLISACREFGIRAEITGRNDVTAGGRKFSGNAGYEEDGRVMHHGTILLSTNLDMMEQALKVPEDKLISKGIRSVRSRVVNLSDLAGRKIPAEEFAGVLREKVFGSRQFLHRRWKAEELEEIEKIRETRYGSWDWNFGSFPVYEIRRVRRIEGCGTVRIGMNVLGGKIREISVSGDFVGEKEISDLEELLIGCRLEPETAADLLERAGIGSYIFGMSAAAMAGILCGTL